MDETPPCSSGIATKATSMVVKGVAIADQKRMPYAIGGWAAMGLFSRSPAWR